MWRPFNRALRVSVLRFANYSIGYIFVLQSQLTEQHNLPFGIGPNFQQSPLHSENTKYFITNKGTSGQRNTHAIRLLDESSLAQALQNVWKAKKSKSKKSQTEKSETEKSKTEKSKTEKSQTENKISKNQEPRPRLYRCWHYVQIYVQTLLLFSWRSLNRRASWTELETWEGVVCGMATSARNLKRRIRPRTTAFVAVPHLSM